MKDTINYKGLTFSVTHEHDHDHAAPWKENDGHGPVREGKRCPFGHGVKPEKRPGELVLMWENGDVLLYDFAEAMKIARKDWGVSQDVKDAFKAKHGRDMKRGEIAEHAVKQDFDYLRRYCNDQWSYVGVVVELLDIEGDGTGLTNSLWGIESDASEYLADVAIECAHEVISENSINRARKNLRVGSTIYRIKE